MSPTSQFWISTAISLVALILALLGFYQQWMEKRPQLKIAVNQEVKGLPLVSDGAGSMINKDVPVLSIYLSNPSEMPIPVRSVNLVSKGRPQIELKEFNSLYPNMPTLFTVEPYRGYKFIVYGQKLANDLKKEGYPNSFQANVEVVDEVGKRYKSKQFSVSVRQLLET